MIKQTLFALLGLIFFISCSKESTDIEIVTSELIEEIEIPGNSILKVNLGNFGDEEGAGIYKQPANARVSLIERSVDAINIIYNYQPNYNYAGIDTVILSLYRGSDGVHMGNVELKQIVINVKR